MKPLKILLLEDSEADAILIQHELRKEKITCECRVAMDKSNFLQEIEKFSPDIVLSDHSIPQFSSSEALKITRERLSHIPFILVTGNVSEEFAINIIREGADDYILKDRMTRLPAAIRAALKQRKSLKEIIDYRYALDQSSIVTITNEKGVITYANNNFSKVSQCAEEELNGQAHSLVTSGHHPFSFIKTMWDTISKGKIWRGEFCNKAKDKTIYWTDTTIVPFLTHKGRPYQYISISKDISERKNVEQELYKSNQQFKYAIEATTDIIWELNFETGQYQIHEDKGNFLGIKESLTSKLGIESKHIIDKDRSRIKKSFASAKKDPIRHLWVDEYQVYAVNNTIVYIINHATFIRDKDGKAIKAIGAITDITEKKKLESDLFEQQKKEQQKITAMAQEAQEKERNRIGQELHDNVNQILSGTKLLLSTLIERSDDTKPLLTECLNYLQNAINENRKLAHILVTPDFDANTLAAQTEDLTDKMLASSKIDVKINTVFLDEALMSNQQKLAVYRIVQEQCTNIIKYAHAKTVTISLSTIEHIFKLIISDDGTGMGPGTKTRGIGLRNIKGRVNVYNGVVIIKTGPGEGFILEVTFLLNN